MITQPPLHVAQLAADIQRQARDLINIHGQQASAVAARKALSLVASGDRQGYADWLHVLHDVDVLLDEQEGASSVLGGAWLGAGL